MATNLRPPSQGQQYELDNLVNFTGGLNRTDDTSNVDSTSLIELTNMDPDPRGGVRVRGGVRDQMSLVNPAGLVRFDLSYQTLNADLFTLDTSQLDGLDVLHVSERGVSRLGRVGNFGPVIGDVLWGNAGDPTAGGNSGYAVFMSLNDGGHNWLEYPATSVYQLGGYTVAALPGGLTSTTSGARYWSDAQFMSTAGSGLDANVWENDYESPSSPGHPTSKYSCVQNNRAWVVDATIENRVRFSHPNDPRYWHQDDWVDIGSAASAITSLYALGDFVLVVKQDGLWGILGNTLDSLRVQQFSESLSLCGNVYLGCTSAHGVGSVWVWTVDLGLISVAPDGSTQVHSEQLRKRNVLPLVDEISFALNKVWCRSSADGGTYVYHLATQSWSFYDYQVRSAVDFFGAPGAPSGQSPGRAMALDPTRDLSISSPTNVMGTGNLKEFAIVEIDADLSYDNTSVAADYSVLVQQQILAWLRTGWIIGATPTERKRWGRPRITLESYDSSDFNVKISAYKNFEEYVVGSTNHSVSGRDPLSLSNVLFALDTSELDGSDVLGNPVTAFGDVKVLRGPSVGRGESVSYKVENFADGEFSDWGVAVMAPRYKPFRIKR